MDHNQRGRRRRDLRRYGQQSDEECASKYGPLSSRKGPLKGKEARRSGRRQAPPRPTIERLETAQKEPQGPSRGKPRPRDSRRIGPSARPRRRMDDNRRGVLAMLSLLAYMSLSALNYFASQSSLEVSTVQNEQQQLLPRSGKTATSLQSKEEVEIFLQTGQLPQNKPRPPGLVNGSKEQQNATDANDRKGGADQEPSQHLRSPGAKLAKRVTGDWPPVSSVIEAHGRITPGADVSGLLDFSIIGFPKTGTTAVLRHLADMTLALPTERCDLVVNDTAKLVTDLLGRTADGAATPGRLLRGIKCPQDVSSEWSLHNYRTYFPRTKLIVGVRHPVFWFESLYNFRVSNVPWKTMPSPSRLARCGPGSQGVCVWRAGFHNFLAQMGKTPLASQAERDLLSRGTGMPTPRAPVGPVFLFDISQLSDGRFRRDLRDFLGLTEDIPPFPVIDTSGRFDHVTDVRRRTSRKKIDICTPEHGEIRAALMEKARGASMWIQHYFLKSKEVVVSNRPFFEAVIGSWMRDPCE